MVTTTKFKPVSSRPKAAKPKFKPASAKSKAVRIKKKAEKTKFKPASKSRAASAKTKRPNGVIYCVGFVLVFPLLKLLFHLEIDKKSLDLPKGPFIVLGNHLAFIDFLATMTALFPHRVNTVAAHRYFHYRVLNKLLPTMGCIPKNLFDPDVRAVMSIMSVLKRGDIILMYPEGRCTVAGEYMGIHKAAAKLIKKLKVPVVASRIDGSYTCMPFWRKGMRLGQVRLRLTNLFSAEDTQTLSLDEINHAIDIRLNGEDAPLRELPRTFRARQLAEGLEKILYYCVKCGEEFTLETNGNTIRCTHCGNTATMDRAAQLIAAPGSIAPQTAQDWYREQSRYEMEKLHEDMEPIVFEVAVRMPAPISGGGFEMCGSGVMTMTPKGWQYDGDLHDEPFSMFLPMELVPVLPFDPDDDIQISNNGNFYLFMPKDARTTSKYATIGECAYWRFVSDIQMTPGKNSGFYK